MSKKISLKQFLMKTGKFDKVSGCISAIESGIITINGKAATNPNYFFNPKKSLIKFVDQKLRKVSSLYFIMNKPAGYLSQKSKEEKTAYDLLKSLNLPKESIQSLHAVGRLDKDTEGLLILTNDGKLSNIIMNPENKIIKKYCAVLEEPADRDKIKILERGIKIKADNEAYETKPCKIKITGEKEVYISLTEGRKRQIRKMLEAVGNKVIYLKRVSIGGLQLGNLKAGEIKQIDKEDMMEKLHK